ncbi:MAG: class I SAM-dependent methyltransferase [Limisphaerales bacterium]
MITDAVSLSSSRPETVWEVAATSVWGQYLTEVEFKSIDRARRLAGPPGDALEVGCEGGRWSEMLVRAGWQVTCIDVNPKTLAICQKRIPTAKCLLANPSDQIIAADSKSVSLLLGIEVAPVTQKGWFLPEAARVLRPGGILMTTVWNKTSPRGAFTTARSLLPGSTKGGFYRRAYRDFRQQAMECGFEVIEETGFCWGPFTRTSNSRLIPAFVFLERFMRLRALPSVSPWINLIAKKTAD